MGVEEEMNEQKERVEVVEDEMQSLRTTNALEHQAIHSKLDLQNQSVTSSLETIMAALTRIETQTTKTNGRVGSLERWRWATSSLGVIVTLLFLYFANRVLVNTELLRKLQQLHKGEIENTAPVTIK